jgi:hypothetical protein
MAIHAATEHRMVEALDDDQREAVASALPAVLVDIEATIVDGIERDKLHVYVGRDSRLTGLLVRLAPEQATRLIRRQMKDRLGG